MKVKDWERAGRAQELDLTVMPLELVKRARRRQARHRLPGSDAGKGWLRDVRQAVGLPVKEAAERMGVSKFEVLRLEKAEMDERIMLGTLRKAAEGLGCELVYGLTPTVGTFAGMEAERRELRRQAADERRSRAEEKRIKERKPWLELIGWKQAFLMELRTILRREGVRVRPRKTERGVAQQHEEFELLKKLVEIQISPEEVEAAKKAGNRE